MKLNKKNVPKVLQGALLKQYVCAPLAACEAVLWVVSISEVNLYCQAVLLSANDPFQVAGLVDGVFLYVT
jgi:hypothetical protein